MLQNAKGSVEVAAKCFYRRKDLPANLLAAADRHACKLLTTLASYNGHSGPPLVMGLAVLP